MYKETNALILREVKYKEADRLLTILTAEDGKLTVKAQGALRKNSKHSAATQQLTYSELTLLDRMGRYTVSDSTVLEDFRGLRSDISALALGSYFAECLDNMLPEGEADAELLRLGLNSLYALSNGLYPQLQIKAAFELRLACLCGYAPQLDCCAVCGKEMPEEPVFSPGSGSICCRRCRNANIGNAVELNAEALRGMRRICNAGPKQFLNFQTDENSLRLLAGAAEAHFLEHAERSFYTLDYWKQVR